MRLKVRDALEELNGKALSRLVGKREITGGRSNRAKISALTHSYRGDLEELFSESTKADLIEMLNDVYTTDRGDLVHFKGLRNATPDDLRRLARMVFDPKWHPTTGFDRTSPVEGVTMMVEPIEQWLDDDDDDWEDEEDEDDADVDDVDDEDEDLGEHQNDEEWRKTTILTAGPALAPPSPLERNELELYPHQTDALTKLSAWWRQRDGAKRAGVLALPTGAGKTRTATLFALGEALASGRRVLWLSHRTELIDQAIGDFLRNGHHAQRPFSVGRFQAGNLKATSPVDVLVASVTTLAWNGNRHLASIRRLLPDLGLIVVDECHHAVATTWRSLLLALRKRFGDARVLGLTATPFRSQKSETNSFAILFDENLLHAERALDLIEQGVLARPVVADVVRTGFTYRADARDAEEYRKWNDIPSGMTRRIGSDAARNTLIVSHLVANHQRYGKTLLFAATIDQAKAIQKAIPPSLPSKLLTGTTPPATRREVLNEFRNGGVQVVVNVDLLTEGTDVPATKTVVIARPVASRGLFRQMVGRAMRGPKAGGNATCNIVGFVDEIAGLVEDQFSTTPTFLAVDAQYEALGVDQPAVQELKSTQRKSPGRIKGYVVLPLAAAPAGEPLTGWWEIETADDKLCLPVFASDAAILSGWFESKQAGREVGNVGLRFISDESLLRASEALTRATVAPRFVALSDADPEDARIVSESLPSDAVAAPTPNHTTSADVPAASQNSAQSQPHSSNSKDLEQQPTTATLTSPPVVQQTPSTAAQPMAGRPRLVVGLAVAALVGLAGLLWWLS